MTALRELAKIGVGLSVQMTLPQCHPKRTLLILGHMRSGSTALSNVLCSRPDVSGYGETHIDYRQPGALGRLVVNQATRRAWRPSAAHLFDKVLHDELDRGAGPAFYSGKAIFLAREPVTTTSSIRRLFEHLKTAEYGSDQVVLDYYRRRLETLLNHWDRFTSGRRVALTHSQLMDEPDSALAIISNKLGIEPALHNSYQSTAASTLPGAGDPLTSNQLSAITRQSGSNPGVANRIDAGATSITDARSLYADFCRLTRESDPGQ